MEICVIATLKDKKLTYIAHLTMIKYLCHGETREHFVYYTFPQHCFHNGSISANLSVRGAINSDYDYTLSTKFI